MWKTVKLGDVCSISIGKTPSRGNPKFWDKDKRTNNIWLSIADLTAAKSRYVLDSKEYVSDEGAALFGVVPKDTLIMSFKLSIGKLAFTAKELRTNEAIASLKINDEKLLRKEYLYYALSSINWDILAGNDVKVKGKTLNKAKLKEVELQLPPLAEQQRIVAKLDAAFAEIDTAIAAAERNAENAEAILSTAIADCFAHKVDGRDKRKFADVCTLQRGFDLPKSQRVSGEYPLYSANGITDFINMQKVDAPGVITGRSGTIGKVHYSTEKYWALNTALYVRDFKGNIEKYVYYFLKSFDLKKYASGAGVPTLNRNVLSDEEVIIDANIEKQHVVIRKLDDITEHVDELVSIYVSKKILLEKLKSSLLAEELTNMSEAA